MKSLLLLLMLTTATAAQSPDRWKGLVIDETTPENAIAILGKSSGDKTGSFRVNKIEDLLTKSIREKRWRRLKYKNIEGFYEVILVFDTTLVIIELIPKIDPRRSIDPRRRMLDPNFLEDDFGASFTVSRDKFDKALDSENVGRDRPRYYPDLYYLYAKSPKTFLIAAVSNHSQHLASGPMDEERPGSIQYVQIVSRTLENPD